MLSSTDFPAPPMFKEEYAEMREKYEKAFLVDFAGKRMMPKEMWVRRYDLYDKADPNDAYYSERSIYQFHYNFHPGDNELTPRRKICDLDWDWEGRSIAYGDNGCENAVYEDLDYPQWDLENKYFGYEMSDACSFLPESDNFEKHKELYLKIKSVEKDPAKWVEALMEQNDHKFVCHSIEYRLGGNLDNKRLWLRYIEYLKTHDIQKLLQTYSKYIRFFLEDEEMIDEYREAVNKHGPVLVPWKNTQDFETYDEHFFEKEKEYLSYKRTLPVESPPLLHRFNAEGMIRQNFPFHDNLMLYIRQNASAKVLHKLYKTCKFFYQRFPKTLCYKVDVDDGDDDWGWNDSDEEVDDDANVPVTIKNLYLKVSSEWLSNTPINNFFIANVFRCVSEEDPLALSKIIPKIYKCSAKSIEIFRQQFSFDDLKVLIGHGNVLSLSLSLPENSSGSCLHMEDILQLTPCIKDFSFWRGIQCTSNTAKKLCEMEFKNKIDDIRLNLTNGLLEPHDFAKFVVKNCSPNAIIRVYCKFDGQEAFVANFKPILDAALRSDFKKDDHRVLSF